jgi:hypothetical protein
LSARASNPTVSSVSEPPRLDFPEILWFPCEPEWLVARLGPPHGFDEDPYPGLGVGPVDGWRFVATCGLDVRILFDRKRRVASLIATSTDVAHVRRHVDLAGADLRIHDDPSGRAPARFEIWRQDDHGHRFLMEVWVSESGAACRLAELERSAHKQTYWIADARDHTATVPLAKPHP